ncbi:MAG: polyprenyl synthetase family protein [Candidatus Asgardarchaeia archaeon]
MALHEEEYASLQKEFISTLEKLLKDNLPENIFSVVFPSFIKGKFLRPILAIETAKAINPNIRVSKEIIRNALIVELVHDASLCHDDVIDNDYIRRGKPSPKMALGNHLSILCGDILFAIAYEIGAKQAQKIAELLGSSAKKVALGVALQVYNRRRILSLSEYLKIASLKTGALFEVATQIGCFLSENLDYLNLVKELGNKLGVAYQIRDDILGLIGDPKTIGKPVGIDIINGEPTILVIYGMQKLNQEQRDFLRDVYSGKTSEFDIPTIQRMLKEGGVIDAAYQEVEKIVSDVKELINGLPNPQPLLTFVNKVFLKNNK